MESLVQLVSDSPLQNASLWMLRSIPGFPPIIQTVHIIGIAVVMGSIALLNLRILGLAIPSQSIQELSRRVLPWFWIALVSNVISGAVFVLARPARYFNNPVFVWKMGLLIAMLALVVLFIQWYRRHPETWDVEKPKAACKLLALGILLLLLGICTGGRWIAYLEYLQYPLWTMEIFDAGPQDNLLLTIENTGLAQIIASTNWFPTLETIHVIAATFVLGSILWVDMRLLGLAATRYAISNLSKELVPWTWGAFIIASITGVGMLITRLSSHVLNPAFQWKMALLALAGLNMAYFHLKVYKQIEQWDEVVATPNQLKLIGATSLLLWCGVMLAGRWVGHIV